MLHGEEFELHPAGGRYEQAVAEHWCFEGRAFGGYTSALALGALLEHTGRPVAASLSVTFLEAGTAGPLWIDVESLRRGRSAEVARATVHQAERAILSATAWLVDGWTDAPITPAPMGGRYAEVGAPTPTDGVDLSWLGEEWPSLRFAHRAGIDYPRTWDAFGTGPAQVALWVRVDAGEDDRDPLPHPQLGDVLHADAHLFDSPLRTIGFADGSSLLSLDLTVAWQPGAHRTPATRWRFFEGQGSVADEVVSAHGSFRAEDGSPLAVVSSQGLIRRPR